MARLARIKSTTGVYHVMLKGIDSRNIFMDEEDKLFFMEKLIRARELGEFKLYAYCLMDNHVHLLLKEGEELGVSIKRITVGYVRYHNQKYGRTGHLFQNRYVSEPVENERYLLTVIRYIHNNPMKANMVATQAEYTWSSYQKYLEAYKNIFCWVDTELIQSYFKNIADFEKFSYEENQDDCLDTRAFVKCTDEGIKDFIKANQHYSRIMDLTKTERDECILIIYKETGSSIRQLSRVLGIGKRIVENAIKEQ
ncbi:transposase [Acetobacterium sp.]|uniref:transposase n=1 Tax=Acetobacterium sp. TaxID=1872094 RepID=UPI000CC071DD|nr:transposase [Acetobacterium sp.]MDO9492907.1 transposase [Acetobacterium sp.]PKM75521.1 MAG: transposase [Firmicutes bacterium HGW-Firmicutes-17]